MRRWVTKTSVLICVTFFVILIFLAFLVPDDNELSEETAEDCCRHRRNRYRSPLGPTFLVVLILSAPDDWNGRKVVRQTWFNFLPSNCRAYFAIGSQGLSEMNLTALEREQTEHKDLLFMTDIIDTYGTLTAKLVAAFKRLIDNVEFLYIFKADLDTFALIHVIVEELERRNSTGLPLYWGFFDGRARVKRRGRWAETSWNLCDRYLPYARGGGYVLSAELVEYVASNAEMLQLFSNEDVSLGAWLAPLKIERRHDPRFDTEHVSRGCHNSYVVTHKHDTAALYSLYNNVLQTGQLCGSDGQFRHRLSYIYDWSVLPSLCCIRNDTSVP